MNRAPYTPRPRCWRCKGRRVIAVDHLEYVEFVPCPSCHHRGPPSARPPHDEHVVVEARAA